MPTTDEQVTVPYTLEVAGHVVVQQELTRAPVKPLTVYVLPHSHTDIGYTATQTAIEEKQVNNLLAGMEAARRTADYPPGARFVWNVEVLWAADLFLNRMNEQQQQVFLDAVQSGQVALCGMYLNELTGLCRPEELVRLFRYATQLREQTGTMIDTAMISDVPGYTWGTVTAMNQAGLRYFSVAPNYFDRIGDILVQWENKPFWWQGPDDKSRVLVWIPFWGYAMSHVYRGMTRQLVDEFLEKLELSEYPYEIAYVRWAGYGDNAVPDPSICDFVKQWNEDHVWPRFIISSAGEAFRAFEEKHGGQLPVVQGDWTPYWEDGAGSSALETAMNRASSDRVSQAEALWAMLDPTTYPAQDFAHAWRNVLLYSEHTWGAWCSVSSPNRKETLEQWAIKRSYAAAADTQTRHLLSRATALAATGEQADTVDVYNTGSWARTELVTIPRDFCEGRNRVTDVDGHAVASQRLANGDLVILARDVAPFAAVRFQLSEGQPYVDERVKVEGHALQNDCLRLELDPQTGAIRQLVVSGTQGNWVDIESGHGLNAYAYFLGDDPEKATGNELSSIQIRERGPLVASLLVSSTAPGCFGLTQEISLAAGMDHVTILNTVDKARLVADSYHAVDGKESVNFEFPFNVPDGQVRVEVPFAVVRPDLDQIPSACKNWFTTGRWVDVSNAERGVTWVTLDAPLIQVGGLTANLLNSQADPKVWRKQVGPTQQIYSWVMNNHWGTNYRAFQEGPVVFRYVVRPHAAYDPAAATRLAIAQSQPLLPVRGRGPAPDGHSRLRVTSNQVVVTGCKPADDGRAIIVRLWAASESDVETRLEWSEPQPVRVFLSDTSEQPREELQGDSLLVPAWGLVTIRAEFPALATAQREPAR